MSVDYYLGCRTCRRYRYFGVLTGLREHVVMGYATNDEAGRVRIGTWIMKHADHGPLLLGWHEETCNGMERDPEDE